MKIATINGQTYLFSKKINLTELITYFNYTKRLFILEYNQAICPIDEWEQTFIADQDKIEVITIVGGG